MSRVSGTWSGSYSPTSDTSSRIISTYPESGETVASTTVPWEIDIYYNDTELFMSGFTKLKTQFLSNEFNGSVPNSTIISDIGASGESTISGTSTLPKGGTTMIVGFYNASSTQVIKQEIINFIVVERLFTNQTPVNFSEEEIACATATGLEYITCKAMDYLKNTLGLLFVPNEISTQRFVELSLEDRFPFAYAYEMPVLYGELFDSTQTATSTIAIEFGDFGSLTLFSKPQLEAVPYSALVKQIIGWLLWLSVIMFVYERVIRTHDTHTPS